MAQPIPGRDFTLASSDRALACATVAGTSDERAAVLADAICIHTTPGVSVHRIGGHTAGIQSVRVWTRRGWVVVASDASHLYANMEQGRPFPIVYNVADMLEGHRRLNQLAASPRHIVPGHDPLVMRRYAAPGRELEGVAVRLDTEPAA